MLDTPVAPAIETWITWDASLDGISEAALWAQVARAQARIARRALAQGRGGQVMVRTAIAGWSDPSPVLVYWRDEDPKARPEREAPISSRRD